MTTDHLIRKRQRLLLARCEILTIREEVYHGSPLSGLEEIRRCGRIEPQWHGILPGDWFCVSINDNMIHNFSDGERCTGLCFDPVSPLNILKLDQFHLELLVNDEGNVGQMDDSVRLEDEPYTKWCRAFRYEKNCCGVYASMSKEDLMELLPDHVHGVAFPWFSTYIRSQYDEAELALTSKGCDLLWKSPYQVVVHDRWYDQKASGWSVVRRKTRTLEYQTEDNFCLH